MEKTQAVKKRKESIKIKRVEHSGLGENILNLEALVLGISGDFAVFDFVGWSFMLYSRIKCPPGSTTKQRGRIIHNRRLAPVSTFWRNMNNGLLFIGVENETGERMSACHFPNPPPIEHLDPFILTPRKFNKCEKWYSDPSVQMGRGVKRELKKRVKRCCCEWEGELRGSLKKNAQGGAAAVWTKIVIGWRPKRNFFLQKKKKKLSFVFSGKGAPFWSPIWTLPFAGWFLWLDFFPEF